MHEPNSIDAPQLEQAARRLLEGGLVAFPTETVFGLGADAENPAAVARIYAAKQRPAGHPLIVHVAPGADLSWWADSVPPAARALADAFWPGPLTLILPRAARIPPAVSGGHATIGVRCPSHPVAQALLTRFAALKPGGQGGVAAPSANKFGQVSPTHAEHVRSEFPELGPSELLILDGEPATVGIESTIVDVSDPSGHVAILRPGHIGPEQIAAVLGVMPGWGGKASPQVSGSLKAHYAPRTPLYLVAAEQLESVLDDFMDGHDGDVPRRVAALVFQAPSQPHEGVDYHPAERDAHDYARHLYATLRRLDNQGYDALVIESPPDAPEWHAVRDRLRRAAAAFEG